MVSIYCVYRVRSLLVLSLCVIFVIVHYLKFRMFPTSCVTVLRAVSLTPSPQGLRTTSREVGTIESPLFLRLEANMLKRELVSELMLLA